MGNEGCIDATFGSGLLCRSSLEGPLGLGEGEREALVQDFRAKLDKELTTGLAFVSPSNLSLIIAAFGGLMNSSLSCFSVTANLDIVNLGFWLNRWDLCLGILWTAPAPRVMSDMETLLERECWRTPLSRSERTVSEYVRLMPPGSNEGFELGEFTSEGRCGLLAERRIETESSAFALGEIISSDTCNYYVPNGLLLGVERPGVGAVVETALDIIHESW